MTNVHPPLYINNASTQYIPKRDVVTLLYSKFLFAFSFLFFEECPAGVYYADQLNHMYYSKSHKLWVAVLSVPDVPHPDCLEDPYLPNLILAAFMPTCEYGFPSVNQWE